MGSMLPLPWAINLTTASHYMVESFLGGAEHHVVPRSPYKSLQLPLREMDLISRHSQVEMSLKQTVAKGAFFTRQLVTKLLLVVKALHQRETEK